MLYKKILAPLLIICSLCLALSSRADESPSHGVILLYHHVATDTPAITSITPQHFAEQMQFLADNQFTVWPLPKLVAHIQQHKPVPDKVVSITFDDNYQSVYEAAFPLLKKRGWPFTIFVSTDAVDQNINMQASWQQLREMARSGASIANHSASHAHLLQRLQGESTSAWKQRITKDINKAQRRIKEETGQEHKLFAYPFGEVDQELAELVQDMGYIGIGQHSGPAVSHYPGLSLPRFPFAGNYSDVKDFAVKALTLPLTIEKLNAADAVLVDDKFEPTLLMQLSDDYSQVKNLQCYGTGQGELPVKWVKDTTAEISPNSALKPGRSRYNCTLPSSEVVNGTRRFHWYSHPWIRPTAEGVFLD